MDERRLQWSSPDDGDGTRGRTYKTTTEQLCQ
jgi:hypothetical protein